MLIERFMFRSAFRMIIDKLFVVWISVQLCDLVFKCTAEQQAILGFKLERNMTTYVAYSGGLTVTYSLPSFLNVSSAQLDLIEVEMNGTQVRSVITSANLPGSILSSGELSFECGTVDHAGRYILRLTTEGGPDVIVTETTPLVVTWPRVDVLLPTTHVALDGDLDIRLSTPLFSDLKCTSLHEASGFDLQLIYFGRTEMKNGVKIVVPRKTVYEKSVASLEDLIHASSWTIPCALVDETGIYQAVVKWAHDRSSVVATSNMLNVTSSSAYNLSVDVSSIFPCQPDSLITVHFTQPACAGTDDRVRLFQRVQRAGTMSLFDDIYITEQKTKVTSSSRLLSDGNHRKKGNLQFSCELFDVDAVPGYCFVYVSTAQSGAVGDRTTLCLPTKHMSGFVDGMWSDWSSWSGCSVSCGRGRHSRYRTCDNPAPSVGGRYCHGDTFQWQYCQLLPCPESLTTVATTDFLSEATDENTRASDYVCQCGCQLIEPVGQLIAPANHNCFQSNRPVVWNIIADDGRVVQLTFRLLTNSVTADDSVDKSWVKVKDGQEAAAATMVAMSFGNDDPRTVTSLTRYMVVEYHAANSNNSRGGLMASYVTVADNSTVLRSGLTVESWLSSWQAMVTVAGLTFAGVVLVMTVVFVCYHRVGRSTRPRKTQVGQALVGSEGRVSSRCRHVDGSSVWGGRARSADDSPTRSYLLAPHPCPFYHHDQNLKYIESNVDLPLDRSTAYPTVYRYPGANYYEPTADCGPHLGRPVSHSEHAIACVNCNVRRSLSSGCSSGGQCPRFTGEIFVDGPPERVDDKHKSKRRPPIEGSDLEITPVKTVRAPDDQVTRGSVRPDGQSPDATTESTSTDKLRAASSGTLSDIDASAADELEYDDYIPQLPGSCFEMDPHAYTLTWSKQPNTKPFKNLSSLSASEASLTPAAS